MGCTKSKPEQIRKQSNQTPTPSPSVQNDPTKRSDVKWLKQNEIKKQSSVNVNISGYPQLSEVQPGKHLPQQQNKFKDNQKSVQANQQSIIKQTTKYIVQLEGQVIKIKKPVICRGIETPQDIQNYQLDISDGVSKTAQINTFHYGTYLRHNLEPNIYENNLYLNEGVSTKN